MCYRNINYFITILILGLNGILFPVRGIEACLIILQQLHLVCAGGSNEVISVKTYRNTAVQVFAVSDIAVSCQRINQQISFVSQVVGFLNDACLDYGYLLIQFINSGTNGIDLIYHVFYLQIQIVLIFNKRLIYRRGILYEAGCLGYQHRHIGTVAWCLG